MHEFTVCCALSGFSEVESKPAVLSEVNRKVKANRLTTNNLVEKPANQRQQKPQPKKGKPDLSFRDRLKLL